MSRVVIVPGNGCAPIEEANWYSWLADELRKLNHFKRGVMCQTMPDPDKARMAIWLPFIKDKLGCDEDTIIIGHSSGAEAAMRLLETNKVKGCILVSPCHTDLGLASERISGYYSAPWQWEAIASHADFITIFGSENDPFIPVSEMEHVHKNLTNSEFVRYKNKGHFMTEEFPELLEYIKNKVVSPALNSSTTIATIATTTAAAANTNDDDDDNSSNNNSASAPSS